MTNDVLKICSRCHLPKALFEFGTGKRFKFGVRNVCKQCRHEEYLENKEAKSKYNKQHYLNNKEDYKSRAKKQRKNNKEAIQKYKKEYAKTHSEKIRNKSREYMKNKRQSDIQLRLKDSLRARLRSAIKHNQKKGSAIQDLGCSIEEFIIYIEDMFYDNPKTGEKMSWDNYGLCGWHIDHIIAISKFDLQDKEQVKKACHYTNLQPLWAFENIIKGDK
jgi:hypothetical protein